jgi:hypothetical protein
MHGGFDRRRLVPALALTFLVSAQPAVAAEPTVRAGIGMTRCEKLLKDIDRDQGFDNNVNALVYYWLQGYVSAANIHLLDSHGQYIDMHSIDDRKLVPMLFDFCKANPSKSPIDMIDGLIRGSPKISTDQWPRGADYWVK